MSTKEEKDVLEKEGQAMVIQEGEYLIPDGYSMCRFGRTIKVYKTKKNGLKEGDYRCKDCAYYTEGYTSNSHWYRTRVCSEQPKRMSSNGQHMLYRAAKMYGKPCEKFMLRESR